MGHARPAGRGTSGGGSYIDHGSINYPQVLTKFLFCNNRRVDEHVCDQPDGGSSGFGEGDGGSAFIQPYNENPSVVPIQRATIAQGRNLAGAR